LGSQKFRQTCQSSRLPRIQGEVAPRVVAHQYFAEGQAEGFDMAREILAVFKVEVLLTALLRWTGGDDVFRSCIAQDAGAELLVDQDAGLFFWQATGQGGAKSIIDDRLGAADFGCLLLA
jgi:hypothetical protein